MADAHTILAALQVVEEQRVKGKKFVVEKLDLLIELGMLNLRKGWKIYKNTLDALKDESKHDDTIVSSLKFGAGLFYFIISLVPPGLPQVCNFINCSNLYRKLPHLQDFQEETKTWD